MATETVKAPMPGVFYRRPDPDEAPFVEEGDSVEEGAVVGLVGVMKNFHDITTDTAGVIDRFLVDNEAEIEAGQALLELTVD